MSIVDDLLAHPGLYLGIDRDAVPRGDHGDTAAARIVITPLPAASGVSLDYEVFNPGNPDRIRGHVEHTIIGRTHDGGTIMVIGHAHSSSVAILRESEPGTFETDGPHPFPMKVLVSMPEPGRLHHSWWYGPPGGEAEEKDVADLALVG
jgi:hypothetical protein